MTEETTTANERPTPAPDVHRTNIQRELPVKLDDEQLLLVAMNKAMLEDELDQLEQDFGDAKEDWKKRIEDKEAEIALRRKELKDKARRSLVDCYERWRGNVIEVVRSDTGEVVDSRAATLKDTQQTIPGAGDVAADAARTQAGAGVAESPDGDVVPPDDADGATNGKGKRGGKRR
ncbi:MAG TPA: hypothetical protein VN253_00695 [Kofleriaceae bacterium]|nr:hypothetical protein [Kofleriaceae bacterium]